MHIAGLIPARGRSKGIPDKNIIELAGRPLIAYTIQAALQSHTLDRLIVSTDDHRIAHVAEEYGAEVPFIRPEFLAKDDTPILPVVQHAVEYLEENEGYGVDVIVLLQPTSPLRTAADIDAAVKRLFLFDADTVISVCLVEEHPYWMWVAKGEMIVPYESHKHLLLPRQKLPVLYRENGAVYVLRRSVLASSRPSVYGDKVAPYVMPRDASLDIDSVVDLKLAETLLRRSL